MNHVNVAVAVLRCVWSDVQEAVWRNASAVAKAFPESRGPDLLTLGDNNYLSLKYNLAATKMFSQMAKSKS